MLEELVLWSQIKLNSVQVYLECHGVKPRGCIAVGGKMVREVFLEKMIGDEVSRKVS